MESHIYILCLLKRLSAEGKQKQQRLNYKVRLWSCVQDAILVPQLETSEPAAAWRSEAAGLGPLEAGWGNKEVNLQH